ncbi:MAG TPA: class II aldolase/adducin family protein [Vicinamibacterales bacterium]|nr:class II aldolase/adducin family protein [Vicinamibacterales bacterium]
MYRRELLSLGVMALLPQIRLSAQAASPDLLNDLVAGNHVLANEGVLDGYGHISVRHPGNKNRFLLSRSLAPESVTVGDLMEHDLDGVPVDAKGRAPYKERFIHSEIYRVRPDVNAVVHCHTPSLIPFGVTRKPLRPMYHQSAFLAAGVPVFEIRDAAGMTNMLIETPALGRALAKTLADKPAVLMRGHGAVVVADTIPNVVGRSIYLDLNARIQIQAIALGGPITEISAEEARKYAASDNYSRAWELWKKKAR